jgi:hypothetical protein
MAASEIAGRHPFPDPYLNNDGHAIAGLSTPQRVPAHARQCSTDSRTVRPSAAGRGTTKNTAERKLGSVNVDRSRTKR